ncbi:hypothetical protein TUA1478L_22030 [Lactiplantibacillus plantarum]
MATATLSDEEIRERIKTGKHMLFFTADWCPDCAFIKPVMPQIEAKYDQYDWITVDRDANIEIAQDMGVMGFLVSLGLKMVKKLVDMLTNSVRPKSKLKIS